MQTLAALPDQDSFYDVTDCLEQQGMEHIIQQHVANPGADLDLKQQFVIYEVSPSSVLSPAWEKHCCALPGGQPPEE